MKFLKYFFTALYSELFVYALFFAKRRRNMHTRYLNFIPFRKTISDFHVSNFMEKGDVINFFSNLLGNIALFIPYTFILVIWCNYRNGKRILLSVFLLSISVEVLQYIFQVGVADIDDVLLNTIGGWAGTQFFLMVKTQNARV